MMSIIRAIVVTVEHRIVRFIFWEMLMWPHKLPFNQNGLSMSFLESNYSGKANLNLKFQ